MPNELPTGTVTFLFTDIEGSTRLLHEAGADGYAAALDEHRRLLRHAFDAHGGVEVDTQGDAFFVAFATAPDALAAAAEAQEALSGSPIRVRMGLHTGRPTVTAEGYVGVDVHRAARIAAAGHGGQVLLSAATRELVDVALRSLGEHRLKDLPAPERLYQLGSAEFPPLRSLNQTNLPAPAATFVGRERELGEVLAVLRGEEHRILTLTGPGGSGKTRLAIEAGSQLVGEYEHGVWWVPLASLADPELVLQTAAGIVGARDGLAAHIGDRRMLILLDNLEQLTAAAPDIASLLAGCSGLRLLVTSREPLRLTGEQEYPVPPLAHGEAVELFVARARTARPDLAVDEETVSTICRRLDELPLAIELAAARVRALSPAQILERLEQRLVLLTGGARDLPERQRTLRATIAWSHDLLTSDEQRLFARLAVFAGGCTLESAEIVAQADLDLLQSLVDKSLLRHTGERFWVLATIREFAAERLAGSEEATTVRRRHAEHVLDLVEEAESGITGPEQTRWWQRLTDEIENIRAALAWACEGGDPALALRLSGAMWRYWWQRGHYREGRRWYEAALEAGRRETESLRARAIYGLANMALGSGDEEEAIRLLEACLAVFQSDGDGPRTMNVLTDLGIAHNQRGRLDRAEAFFREVLDLARAAADRRRAAVTLINLSDTLMQAGELDQAAEYQDDAFAELLDMGDEQSAGNVLGNRAYVELRRGDADGAAAFIRRAVALSRKTDDRYSLAHSLIVAAAVLAARADGTGAAVVLGRSAALQEEMDLAVHGVEGRLYDETAADLRVRLGTEEFERALTQGRSTDHKTALDMILAALA